jgi:hypothetical protein
MDRDQITVRNQLTRLEIQGKCFAGGDLKNCGSPGSQEYCK